MKKSICIAGIIPFFMMQQVVALEEVSENQQVNTSNYNESNQGVTYNVRAGEVNDLNLPCPFGWSVRPNPSVDNSLSYTAADANLAISVTSLVKTRGNYASTEAYARVASQQMGCELPLRSNLIENAWSFNCPQDNVEAIVYGEPNNLALLVISGRSADTEAKLEEFIKFLDSEAARH